MSSSAYTQKKIISAFLKTLQIKLALSIAKWIPLPLNEDSTAESEACSRSNGEATPYLIKRPIQKSTILGVFEDS